MSLIIRDHFDVAHLLGHPALDHLAAAMRVYGRAAQSNLFDITKHEWPNCLEIGGVLTSLRAEERKSCVQAVILFQAMMEKIPYFIPKIGSGLKPPSKTTFAGSWCDLISQIGKSGDRAKAQTAFDYYSTNFYKGLRNPIIHGKKSTDIKIVEEIRVQQIHEGMRQGWQAYDFLLVEAFAPEQSHQPSWDLMASAHGVPVSIVPTDFPDLSVLETQYLKKHLDGARVTVGD